VPAIIQVRLTHKVEGTMLSVVVSLSEVADKRQRKAELGSRKERCSQKSKRIKETAISFASINLFFL
jgi:hypothetical protein